MYDQPLSSKESLIKHLEENTQVLKNLDLKKALEVIDRKDFVHEDYKVESYEDYPLPIGFNQTISQPTVVVHMISMLDIKPGQRVLDVGCGSGWSTALLAFLVGKEGEVVAIDVLEEMLELTRNHISAYQEKLAPTAVFHSSEEKLIYTENFDRVLVNASFQKEEDIPEKMKEGLKEKGAMVAPVGNDLIVFTKKEGEFIEEKRLSGVVSFVPYITE